ncbi:hypothetical protein SISSUDRAFT_1132307 [Sistotremastrum suecicum HHB10207 ss-3]|uniref:F-box domain-containing protein n=1 Tax=Sistotremastrum suecicum HHB10207 ss-3 TaxID=1314776 RepID=A0A165Z196_9AGAM|nr:hypothetical protein SISSUDRAFT_1132307 [Sistotremastrum suecicum HHB10207 ss-3]
MTRLTTLRVRDVSLGPQAITLALESCHHLECFEIENYILPVPSGLGLNSQPILLPRLKHFIILYLHWEDMISIVRRIEVPATAHISLGISNGDVGNRPGEFESKLAALLQPRIQLYDRAEIGTGYLRLYSSTKSVGSIVFQFWDWTAGSDTSTFVLSYFSEARTEHFTAVRVFGTSTSELPSADSLFSNFAKWQDPSYLSLESWGQLNRFFVTFGTSVVLCPRLRRLDIARSQFDPSQLLAFLRDRQHRASKIECLTIHTRTEDEMTYVYEEHVGKLVAIPTSKSIQPRRDD